MAATSIKYRGLCETCDYDATCKLKRSPRLEIIHCEQFSTQPVMYQQAIVREEASPSAATRSHSIGAGRAKRLTFSDPV